MKNILFFLMSLLVSFWLCGQTINPQGPLKLCNGSDVVLKVENAGAGSRYQWVKDGADIAGATSSQYTVSTPGKYNVKVDDRLLSDVVVILAGKPVASFTLPTSLVCGRNSIQFVNLSRNGNDPATQDGLQYSWDFGNGQTSTDKEPVQIFDPGVGIDVTSFTIKLKVTNADGCTDEQTKIITIEQSPHAVLQSTIGKEQFNNETYFKSCSANSQVFEFWSSSSTISTNTKYLIRWGDGTPDEESATPWLSSSRIQHTYKPGYWKLTHLVYRGTCVDSVTYNVYVGLAPVGGLKVIEGGQVCSGSEQKFVLTGTAGNFQDTKYELTYGDGAVKAVFNHPVPDTIRYAYLKGSCGTNSSGSNNVVYPNAFGAFVTIMNACGRITSDVMPVYISDKSKADFIVAENACVNEELWVRNSGAWGNKVEKGSCNPGKLVWLVRSASAGASWSLLSGSLGRLNNETDPAKWEAGTDQLRIRFASKGVYTITQYMANNGICGLDSVVKTVYVNPKPVGSVSFSRTEGCAPMTVTATVATAEPPVSGTNMFNWSVDYKPIEGCFPATSGFSFAGGSTSSPQTSQFLFSNPGEYTITLLVSSPGGDCIGEEIKQKIIVKGKPVVTLQNIPAASCENLTIRPSAAVSCYSTGATYAWSFLGGTPSSSTLLDPGQVSFNRAGEYAVLLASTNECGTTTVSKNISIRQTPVLSMPADIEVCNGKTVGPLNFTSSVSGSEFSWTNSLSSIGFSAAGTGNIPAFTAINTGAVAEKATVTAQAVSGACVSKSETMNITVHPSPKLVVNNPTICAGGSVLLNVSGADTYTWSPSTGLDQVVGPSVMASPAVSTDYTVTGLLTTTGCRSSAIARVSVQSIPRISGSFQHPTQCDVSDGTISLSGLISGTSYKLRYKKDGQLQSGSFVTDASGSAVLSGLSVGKYSEIEVELNGCSSNQIGPFELKNPIPPPIPVLSTNSPVCSGNELTISVTNPVAGARFNWAGPGGFSASTSNPSLQRANTTVAMSGVYQVSMVARNCQSESGSIYVVVNQSPLPPEVSAVSYCQNAQASALTAIPGAGNSLLWYSTPSGGIGRTEAPIPVTTSVGTFRFYVSQRTPDGCESPRAELSVTVNSTPFVTDQAVAVCTGETFSFQPVQMSAGMEYVWGDPLMTGGMSGGTTGSGSSVTGTLNNPTGITQTATYSVLTKLGSCAGNAFKLVVSVNPAPFVPNQEAAICSGESFTIAPRSGDPGVVLLSGTLFSWSDPVINPLSSVSGASGQSAGTATISQVLTNRTNQKATVNYIVTPRVSAADGCSGKTFTVLVTVHPAPRIATKSVTICSGASFRVRPQNNTMSDIVPDNTVYTWSAPVSSPVGAIKGGTAQAIPQSEISQMLVNSTDKSAVITYTVTPVSATDGKCTGDPFTVMVTVDPVPDVKDADVTICHDSEFTILPSNVPSNTTYLWDAPISALPGAIAGSAEQLTPQTSIRQRLFNTTNIPSRVLYTVRPVAGTCSGEPFKVTVTVNPAPQIPAQEQIICSGGTFSIDPAHAPPGTVVPAATTYTWSTPISSPAGAITGGADQIVPQPLIAHQLFNTTDAPATITYTVLPVSGATGLCTGTAFPVVITVNPDARARISVRENMACYPFRIDKNNIQNVSPATIPAEFSWYANGKLIGTERDFPGYVIQQPLDSVTIKLVMTSKGGCRSDSTEHRFFTKRKPDVSFRMTGQTGCGPVTVQFENTSTYDSTFTYLWYFGNGQSSTTFRPDPVVYYPDPFQGDIVYKVRLLVINDCDTLTEVKDVIVSSKPLARFTPSISVGCSPMVVSFNNTSRGGNNRYIWDFGDGSTRLISNEDTVQHTYFTGVRDTIRVRLTAINECGADTSFFNLVITPNTNRLDVAVSGIEQNGCTPHTVTFYNNSAGVAQFRWDFGDGNIRTTTKNVDTIVHSFLTPGKYTVRIFATNSCSDTSTTESIDVYPQPLADFRVSSMTACVGDSIRLENLSTAMFNF